MLEEQYNYVTWALTDAISTVVCELLLNSNENCLGILTMWILAYANKNWSVPFPDLIINREMKFWNITDCHDNSISLLCYEGIDGFFVITLKCQVICWQVGR